MAKPFAEEVKVTTDKKGSQAYVNGEPISRDKKGSEYVGNEQVFRNPDGKITRIGTRDVKESSSK